MNTHKFQNTKPIPFKFLLQILARAAAAQAAKGPPNTFKPGAVHFRKSAGRHKIFFSDRSNRSRFGCAGNASPPDRFARNLFSGMLIIFWLLIFSVAPARADWPNTNATKFVQQPDITTNGMDIFFENYPTILADDFICTNTGPITDIHLWLSSLQNAPASNAHFELSIWEDVPANPAAGTLSHPGKRLWREVLFPGDYTVRVLQTNLMETFWNLDPAVPQFMGPDHTLFQYNFYPKQPYIQTGTTVNPKVYWLGVSMQNDDPFQGWKTSTNHLGPDFAVLGHYDASGTNVTGWKTLFDPRFANVGLDFSFALTTTPPSNPPPPQCVEGPGVKFVQPPKTDGGWDVWDSGPWVLADDFICTNTGPITDIHIWGSWLNDIVDPNPTFWVGVYDDVPAITNGPAIIPSRPGTNLVWQQWFGPGQYAQEFVGAGIEQFMDPGPPAVMGPDSKEYYYCFYPSNLVQRGTTASPKIYWLAVYTMPSQGTSTLFGWKNSQIQQFDISTHTPWPGAAPITANWQPTRDPNNIPLDLAFKLNTGTNPPPACCPEGDGVKFVQWPNAFQGSSDLDVNASQNLILADDFLCNQTGPITDIHLWGSWLNDNVDLNASYTLSIWSDVPAKTNGTVVVPSHPGVQVWSQPFGPGDYSLCFYTNTSGSFYDASVPAILGADTQIYYLCFYPTNPFVQLGTANAPTNYWLAVNAQTTAGAGKTFGWHTSYNHYNDIAVWGNGPSPAAWNPMHDVQGLPLSMAFKVNTSTNGCPQTTVICSTNKTVECGSSWNFDPPQVNSPCCGTNFTITPVYTATNGFCPQVITRVWNITDCLGLFTTCTQIVTVVDTTAPVIICPTNKTVECGSAWSFDTPSAYDTCCGNVTVFPTRTVTNGVCPKIAVRTWAAVDCCNNTNTCSQTVTIVDTTPPVINCPTNIIVDTCDTNAYVTWSLSATDNCSTNITIVSTPPSGTWFARGTTNNVHVVATDACGNTNTCDFLVIVSRPTLALSYNFMGGTVTLTWSDGVLQQAPTIVGPWTDVPLATSPYTTSTSGSYRFFRLRCP
jgi:hypothetical protein